MTLVRDLVTQISQLSTVTRTPVAILLSAVGTVGSSPAAW